MLSVKMAMAFPDVAGGIGIDKMCFQTEDLFVAHIATVRSFLHGDPHLLRLCSTGPAGTEQLFRAFPFLGLASWEGWRLLRTRSEDGAAADAHARPGP